MLDKLLPKRRFGIILLIAAGFMLSNCGSDAGEERDSAILQAEIFLSIGQCQQAIDVLEEVGRDVNNARYLITLSSSYACRGGFSTTRLVGTDLAAFDPPANAGAILGSFVKFSTSSLMTEARDEDYEDTLEAVNILLYAGGIDLDRNPTIARRAAKFNAADQKEMRAFLTYLLMANIGQYLFHYGNGSTTGVKGVRVPTDNTCMLDYSDLAITNPPLPTNPATIFAFLDDTVPFPNGTCSSAGSGHPDFGVAGSLNVARMCQMVVSLNNFFELLPIFLTDVTGNADFAGLGPIDALVTLSRTVLTTSQPSTITLSQTQSQTLCEQDNPTDTQLQYFFAILVETLFI
jgi:hypothetical protein